LRSKGKPILEVLNRLQGKQKPIPNNAKQLPGNTYRLSGKTELELGRTESEPGKIEPSLGKEKLVLVTQISFCVMYTDYREKQIQEQNGLG
jgi:hypothetical protein